MNNEKYLHLVALLGPELAEAALENAKLANRMIELDASLMKVKLLQKCVWCGTPTEQPTRCETCGGPK